MMASLYQLSDEYAAVLSGAVTYDFETGEVRFDLSNVDALAEKVEQKVEAVAAYSKSRKALAEAIKAEEQALAKRRKALESECKRWDEYMLRCVNMCGGKIETPKARVSVHRSKSVEVMDEDLVPAEYKVVKTEERVDKRKVRDAILNDGVAVPGCAIVVNESVVVR